MTTKPVLLGFAGPRGAGKTAAVELLMANHGVIGLGFAQPMRVFVSELLGISLDDLEAYKEEQVPGLPDGVTPRMMLQTLGTEWGRHQIDPDLWVKVAMRGAISARESGYAVAISDVRFENEATAIRSEGGIIIEIIRDKAYGGGHVSDVPLPRNLIDYSIANDGDLADLHKKLLDVLKGAQARKAIEASAGTVNVAHVQV